MNEAHEMVLQQTDALTGEERWYCPTCGRTILLHWPPDFRKIVLAAGDEYTSHHGGKGGLRIGQLLVDQRSAEQTKDDPGEVDDPGDLLNGWRNL